MSFCLDDGSELLFGPASGRGAADEPATAILHSTAAPGEAATHAQMHLTDQPAIARREFSRDGKQIAIVRGEVTSNAVMITGFR